MKKAEKRGIEPVVNNKLEEYLKMQKNDLIRAFKDNTNYPIGVKDMKLAEISIPFVAKVDLDCHSNKNKPSFVRTIEADNKVYKEYWVQADSKTYRRDFKNFLDREYGVKNVPKTLHVDHLLNHKYAIQAGLVYVRVALIESKVNTGNGIFNEKGTTEYVNNEIGIKDKVFLLDYVIAMKAFGIKPFKNKEDLNERLDSIAEELSKFACDDKEITKELLSETLSQNFWALFPENSSTRKEEFEKMKQKNIEEFDE